MAEIEKTCENCEYEHEDPEGTHCRHCIHSAEEHFKLKEIRATEQEIRAKAIDEFVEKLSTNVESFEGVVNGIKADLMTEDYFHEYIWEIAEKVKKGENK